MTFHPESVAFLLNEFFALAIPGNKKRQRHFRISCNAFEAFTGREAMLDDLTDAKLREFHRWQRGRRAPHQLASNRCDFVRQLWQWAHDHRYVSSCPSYPQRKVGTT